MIPADTGGLIAISPARNLQSTWQLECVREAVVGCSMVLCLVGYFMTEYGRSYMTRPNPFRPTFGSVPHTVAGRDDVLDRIAAVFALVEGDPDATMAVTGHRGTGKTVLLNKAVQAARERGWGAVSVSATDGPTAESVIEAVAAAQMERRRTHRRGVGRLAGVQALGFGLSWSPPPHNGNPSLRYILTDFAEQAARSRVGLLIALDEMQHLPLREAREFASALQHVIRNESRPVVFIGAGLTVIESTLLADPGMTFFGRCARIPIGPIDDSEARRAIREPLRDAGMRIDEDALDTAVAAARGYPFMLQQIGYHMWRSVSEPSGRITSAAVRTGVRLAQEAMVNQVFRPDWARLGPLERTALSAMSRDDGPTTTRDVRSRLGMTSATWATYRKRLDRRRSDRRSPSGASRLCPRTDASVGTHSTTTRQEAKRALIRSALRPCGTASSMRWPPSRLIHTPRSGGRSALTGVTSVR